MKLWREQLMHTNLGTKIIRRRYAHMAPAALDPIEGFEFKFYSSDRGEPPHVHVWHSGHKIKFWLGPPVALIKTASGRSRSGFKPKEVKRAREIIEEHLEEILTGWHAFFSGT